MSFLSLAKVFIGEIDVLAPSRARQNFTSGSPNSGTSLHLYGSPEPGRLTLVSYNAALTFLAVEDDKTHLAGCFLFNSSLETVADLEVRRGRVMRPVYQMEVGWRAG
jgi:hypothetical protein